MLAPITNYRHLGSATYGSDARLTVWILAWINHVMLDGGALFDANVFYPARNTLAYAEHLLSISVFTAPTYALTRNPDLAYNIAWLLSYFTCALAAHALAWRVTRDHLASFVGGVAYAFCFYRMLHGHAHIQLLWACWIPLSFLLLEWWWRQPSWPRIATLWLVVLMQVLASWYLAIMVLVADTLLALYLSVWMRPPRGRIPTMLAQVAAAATAGAIVVWPIARHYTFLVALNGDSQAEAVTYAATAKDLLVPPLNTWLGQWLVHHGSTAPGWIWGEKTLFLGFVTLALAGIGLMRIVGLKTSDDPRFSASPDERVALGFFALLLMLTIPLAFGPSQRAVASGSFDASPFGLLSLLPGMSLFRVPARFIQLTTLALAILAAAGAKTLHAGLGLRGRALAVLLLPVMLGEWYLVDFPGGAPQPSGSRRFTVSLRAFPRTLWSRSPTTSVDRNGSRSPTISTIRRLTGIRSSTATRAPSRQATAIGLRASRRFRAAIARAQCAPSAPTTSCSTPAVIQAARPIDSNTRSRALISHWSDNPAPTICTGCVDAKPISDARLKPRAPAASATNPS